MQLAHTNTERLFDMRGNNTQSLNEGTMIDIVQHYFDNVLYAPGKSPLVTSVEWNGGTQMFRVLTGEKPNVSDKVSLSPRFVDKEVKR